MINWNLLKELRKNFLENPTGGDYWTSEEHLENYDVTFARRIQWKWQSVFHELDQLGYSPPEECGVVDWGCGTGVATESYAKWKSIPWAMLEDRSSEARRFARKKIESLGVTLEAFSETPDKPFILLVSHVINELQERHLEKLLVLAGNAQAILWIEPGTREHSQRLVRVREKLLGKFHAVAPCPDQKPCGLAGREPTKYWCHHFAVVPSHIHQDADWRRFSEETGIDLRSLPMSFLVLDKRPVTDTHRSRVLGRIRTHGGFVECTVCRNSEIKTVNVTKRKNPDIYQELRKATFGPLVKTE